MKVEYREPFGNSSVVLYLSRYSPKEIRWYVRLGHRLGVTETEAIAIHASLIHLRDIRHSLKYNYMLFPQEPPKKRELLIGMLEKVLGGEDFPPFPV